jgi:hypothetical protein
MKSHVFQIRISCQLQHFSSGYIDEFMEKCFDDIQTKLMQNTRKTYSTVDSHLLLILAISSAQFPLARTRKAIITLNSIGTLTFE